MCLCVDSVQHHAKSQQHASLVGREHALVTGGSANIGEYSYCCCKEQISSNRQAVCIRYSNLLPVVSEKRVSAISLHYSRLWVVERNYSEGDPDLAPHISEPCVLTSRPRLGNVRCRVGVSLATISFHNPKSAVM